MAKSAARAIVRPAGITLPPDWRTNAVKTWQIAAMLACIEPADYDATAADFEAHHRAAGTLSDDWRREWKAWCHEVLMRAFSQRLKRKPAKVGLFD